MKKLVLLALVVLVSPLAVAQVQTPQPSPAATLKQVVGLTEVQIDYSRPSKRDREIMGGLCLMENFGAQEPTKTL